MGKPGRNKNEGHHKINAQSSMFFEVKEDGKDDFDWTVIFIPSKKRISDCAANV